MFNAIIFISIVFCSQYPERFPINYIHMYTDIEFNLMRSCIPKYPKRGPCTHRLVKNIHFESKCVHLLSYAALLSLNSKIGQVDIRRKSSKARDHSKFFKVKVVFFFINLRDVLSLLAYAENCFHRAVRKEFLSVK